MRKKKVNIINLGCARNLVDSEKILSSLLERGYSVSDTRHADAVIVNTCAFVESAKRESIDTILDLLELKRKKKISKVIIAGCLAERYSRELSKEFKDADAIVGVLKLRKEEKSPAVLLTPSHYAYLKICESCFNCCSYCVIPSIKGKFSSRSIESVVREAIDLDQAEIKEINIIGQDVTAYGMDIYKDKCLVRLLKKISAAVKNVEWIRLLYTYPSHITDELINLLAEDPKICKYVDMPLQHINDAILQRMNRKMKRKEIEALLTRLRKLVPEVGLRTTFIIGFPGETEKQFNELMDFVKSQQFERLGVFAYSREEGTAAYRMPGQVPEKVKQERVDRLMQVQQGISLRKNESLLGKCIKVMIDEDKDATTGLYSGRSEYDAPEVDCGVFVRSRKKVKPGDFVNVLVDKAYEYDVEGKAV